MCCRVLSILLSVLSFQALNWGILFCGTNFCTGKLIDRRLISFFCLWTPVFAAPFGDDAVLSPVYVSWHCQISDGWSSEYSCLGLLFCFIGLHVYFCVSPTTVALQYILKLGMNIFSSIILFAQYCFDLLESFRSHRNLRIFLFCVECCGILIGIALNLWIAFDKWSFSQS